jgi:hypothetical protein
MRELWSMGFPWSMERCALPLLACLHLIGSISAQEIAMPQPREFSDQGRWVDSQQQSIAMNDPGHPIAWGAIALPRAQATLVLVDGSTIPGKLVDLDAKRVVWAHESVESLQVERVWVRGVVLRPTRDPHRWMAQRRDLLDGGGAEDGWKEPDRPWVEGAVLQLEWRESPEGRQRWLQVLNPKAQEASVRLATLESLRLSRLLSPPQDASSPSANRRWLAFDDGMRILVEGWQVTDQGRWIPKGMVPWRWEAKVDSVRWASRLVGVEALVPGVRWLALENPVGQQESRFGAIGLSKTPEGSEGVAPLVSLGDRLAGWSVRQPASSQIAFRHDGSDALLRGQWVVTASAGPQLATQSQLSAAVGVVRGGKLEWLRELAPQGCDRDPQSIDLPLEGCQAVVLRTRPETRLGIGLEAVWKHRRIEPAKGPTAEAPSPGVREGGD